MQVFHMMKKERFHKNNIIYSESDPSCYVFFIIEGEVGLSRLCEFPEKNEPQDLEHLQKCDPLLKDINRSVRARDNKKLK